MDTETKKKTLSKAASAKSLLNMVAVVQPWVIRGVMIVLRGRKTAEEYDAV